MRSFFLVVAISTALVVACSGNVNPRCGNDAGDCTEASVTETGLDVAEVQLPDVTLDAA